MAMYRGRHRNVDEYAASFADTIEWIMQSDHLPQATLDHDPTRYLPRLNLDRDNGPAAVESGWETAAGGQ